MELSYIVRVLLVVASVWSPIIYAACTTTRTILTTVSASTTSTTESVLPTITVTIYSSTVLIGTPAQPPTPTFPPSDPSVNCAYYTRTAIPPVPSPRHLNAHDPVRCITVKTTVTVEYLCVQTDFAYPPPATTSKPGVLTTRVPASCTSRPKSTKNKGSAPPGDNVYPLRYPYFPFTIVECCVACAKQYINVVASAFFAEVGECDCLVNNGTQYPGRSEVCPLGKQPYAFGAKEGVALPGACRVKP